MDKQLIPELKRSNLSNVILLLKRMKYKNIEEFDFIDKPSKSQIEASLFQLWSLGAIDDQQDLTDLGLLMSEFPLDPN